MEGEYERDEGNGDDSASASSASAPASASASVPASASPSASASASASVGSTGTSTPKPTATSEGPSYVMPGPLLSKLPQSPPRTSKKKATIPPARSSTEECTSEDDDEAEQRQQQRNSRTPKRSGGGGGGAGFRFDFRGGRPDDDDADAISGGSGAVPPLVVPVSPKTLDDDDDSSLPHPDPHLRSKSRIPKHLYILPVMLFEFLALSLTRAVLPSLILATFGDSVYLIMGCAEAVRGLLAFVSCPLFGKLSDSTGRRPCLFVTVLGTCAPVCSLALMGYVYDDGGGGDDGHDHDYENGSYFYPLGSPMPQPRRIWIFVFLLAMSGMFSSTFTLVFAYISDAVPKQSDRVGAYGLALATFGLSFTIGPMAGGYLARVDPLDYYSDGGGGEQEFVEAPASAAPLDGEVYEAPGETNAAATAGSHQQVGAYPIIDPRGQQRVFTCTLILTIVDLLYIYFVLPESRSPRRRRKGSGNRRVVAMEEDVEDAGGEEGSIFSRSTKSIQERVDAWRQDVLPQSWTPLDALRVFSGDPFLAEVGRIAFLYYTGLWAVVSTLAIYAARRFRYGPERLGELMSAFGLCTMLAEAVLLRIVVPMVGERETMRLGLAAFALQCVVLGLAFEGWQLFLCVGLSMASNLVYPSLTSLVSNAVAPDAVGEALGAVNGVKALTEGIGPLLFGGLMTISEKSSLPGWPYLLAAGLAVMAYRRTRYLPDDEDDYDGSSYISEKYSGAASLARREGRVHTIMQWLGGGGGGTGGRGQSAVTGGAKNVNSEGVRAIFAEDAYDREDEIRGLLSGEDYDDDDEDVGDVEDEERQQPHTTVASRAKQKLQEMSFFSASL